MAIFKKYYLLFLVLVVLISYGQILGMYVWKDDNAVFFKFNHLDERAGYLGIGLLGSQPYKLTVTPYWFIYKLFGANNLVPYYILVLIIYITTALVVYFTFSKLFSRTVGEMTSFLFACGYIASDGFMWLTTSITQSLSIIFALGVLFFYEKWYWFALGSYFLASYFNPARTHYFIVVIILLEFLYFLKKITLVEISKSLLRLIPFLFIFYKYILFGDSRTGEPFSVLKLILSGELRYLHSFIATTSQMLLPLVTDSKLLIPLGIGVILSLLTLIFFIKGRDKKDLILLSAWMFANLYAFSSLEPFSTYPATARYLAHSFIPLIGILGVISQKNRLIKILVITWGLVNLASSVNYQYSILKERSIPARKFYQDLKKEMPILEKGDIVYIDVADDARDAYNAAFTVSQMPEETALAWRYGLDRYDFSLETEFTKLINKINDNNLSLNKIHTFFYSKAGLIDTTQTTRSNLEHGSEVKTISITDTFSSETPVLVEMSITASAQKFIKTDSTKNTVSKDKDLRNLAFTYAKEAARIRQNSTVMVSSFWQDDIGNNLNDNNIETAWRPNRVEWGTSKGNLTLNLKMPVNINRFVWINAYPNSTPSHYSIEVSPDFQNWKMVAQGQNLKKLESGSLSVIEFNPVRTRYVRMNILESINEDAPGIAEVWVVPSEFSKLSIQDAENFFKNPFEFVPDAESFANSLKWLDNQGLVSVWWKNNKHNKWETSPLSRYPIIYDSQPHLYFFKVPAGGTEVNEIKLDNAQIPGDLVIKNIKVKHPSITDL